MSGEPLIKPVLTPGGAKRYTAEDIATMNTALEATKGNINAAAKLLGVDAHILQAQIKFRPEMKARWRPGEAVFDEGKVKMDEPGALEARATPREIALTDTEKRALALAVNERKMKHSLATLGFKTAEIEQIHAVENFAGQHFKETLNIMHGSLLKSAMRLMMQAERISEKYLQNDSLDEKEKKWYWEIYFEIIEKLRLMTGEVNKAALTKALVEMKRNGPEQKPGFTVPQVAIQINGVQKSNISAGKTGEPDIQQ